MAPPHFLPHFSTPFRLNDATVVGSLDVRDRAPRCVGTLVRAGRDQRCRWSSCRSCCASAPPTSPRGRRGARSRTACSGRRGPRASWPPRSPHGTPAAAVGLEARRPAARHRRPAGAGRSPTSSTALHARRPRRRRCATPCCGSARATSSTSAWRRFPAVRASSISCSPRSASSRCWSAAPCGCAARAIRRRCTSSGSSVAFFGVFTFSFSGRLDRLDWVFYWADAISILALPPLFLHFTLVFPERPRALDGGRARARRSSSLIYAPAIVLGARSRRRRWRAAPADAALFVARHRGARSRSSSCTWRSASSAAWSALTRALAAGVARSPRAGSCAGSPGAPRSAPAPFAFGYALPYALGVEPSLPMQLSAIPLEPDSARLRVGDRALPADGHRGHRQARARLRGRARRRSSRSTSCCSRACSGSSSRAAPANEWVIAFLATLVAVLLAPPVKDVVQNDARSRVLSRSLRLPAGAGRLRPRPEQRPRSAPPGRAARLARRRDAAGRSHGADARGRSRRRTSARCAPRASAMRIRRRCRSCPGIGSAPGRRPHRRARRSDGRRPLRRPRRSSSGATPACTTSSRAWPRTARSRCWRSDARTPASRSTARTWGCWPRWPARSPRRSRTPGSTASCT